MKKLKRKIKSLYKKNRILFTLISIVIVCILIVLICLIFSLTRSFTSSKYGDRLEGIKAVRISDKDMKSYASKFEDLESVKNANIDIKGKIIYINVEMDEDTSVKDAKITLEEGLNSIFDEDIINYYDIQYIVKGDGKEYPTMGYKNSNRKEMSWINRN